MSLDWDELPNKIWMKDGKIVICSTLKNTTPHLLACIEDNIVEIDGHEFIEWRHVQKDYNNSLRRFNPIC